MVRNNNNKDYECKLFSIDEKGICVRSMNKFSWRYRTPTTSGFSKPTHRHLFSNVVHAYLDVDGALTVVTLDGITYQTTGVSLGRLPPKAQTTLFWFASDARVYVINRLHLFDWRRIDVDDVVPRVYRPLATDINGMRDNGRSALVLDFVNSYLIVNIATNDATSVVAAVKRALKANEQTPAPDMRVLSFN